MRLLCLALLTVLIPALARADGYRRFEGHGGPIRGVSISPDGAYALTASFDNSVGYWSVDDPEAEPIWLDGHEAAANVAIFLPDGKTALSAGDDFDLILWSLDDAGLLANLTGHEGKILDLDITVDGKLAVSAGWDGRVGVWDLDKREVVTFLTGHRGPVQSVRFSADGTYIYSASSDGTIRRWSVEDRAFDRIEASHGFGVNRMVVNDQAGWIAYGALDGGVRIVDTDTGKEIADITSGRQPVLALVLTDDGKRIAIGDGEGHIHIVDTASWQTVKDFRAVPRGPVWALAFDRTGRHIIAGTILDHADFWPIDSAEAVTEADEPIRAFHRDPATMSNGERQFTRKCSICHTLDTVNGRRAGPTLHRIFGRKAGTLDGYKYSDALIGANITWNDASLDKLFDIGPDYYTPGSKMPMQRIVKRQDRLDLIEYLKTATRGDAPQTRDTTQ
jgi:cytochrome c